MPQLIHIIIVMIIVGCIIVFICKKDTILTLFRKKGEIPDEKELEKELEKINYDFIPCDKFMGEMGGYVYKTNLDEGLGYYLDKTQ